jgi:hypothetical protein
LADRPVNRLGEAERSEATLRGVDRLVELIRQETPQRVVVVKASIAGAVRQAAALAGFQGEITELPFPVRQWRSRYIDELSRIFGSAGTRPPVKETEQRPILTSRPQAGITQRVTASDIDAGQIRIPITGDVKRLFPSTKQQISVNLRGRQLDASYDPRLGPDKERSGVVRVGRSVLRDVVSPDERLEISLSSDGVVHLR